MKANKFFNVTKAQTMLALFCTISCSNVLSQTTAEEVISYFHIKPFGWATCSNVRGNPYHLCGGNRSAHPDTIILYSNGENDRERIMDAIANFDVIILDGEKGDFSISNSMSIPNIKDKTILGRNNARLCTQWHITPELKQALTDANLEKYSSSSGTGGTLSNGRHVDEERELHTRQTIIDFLGDEKENYRSSGILNMDSSNENIIIRNLIFVGPGSVDVGGADLISNYGATHVWIDHCEFIDGMDGNLDSGKREGGEQFVTYSWNIFRYTERSFSHPYSNGVGWNKGYLQYITYAYNIWGEGCTNRMPLADWVYIHLLNNYYNCAPKSTAIAINANSHALIEGNYAEDGISRPFYPGNYADLYYHTRNNYGLGRYDNSSNTDISLEVPYNYNVIPTDKVPQLLQSPYGAGATIDDLLEILTAPANYYSRRMVLSHGQSWSADKSWDYVSGLVTKSLLKCCEQYPMDTWCEEAYAWSKFYTDNALNDNGSFKNFKTGNIDNIASGKIFFNLYNREIARNTEEGDKLAAKYKNAADFLYNYLRYQYSRIQTEEGYGGFFHKDIYPNQMWLDGLYMGAAFYAEYLHHFLPEDTEGWTDIAHQFITIHRHTFDQEKKLNYHGWSATPDDANSFWANQDGAYKGCSSEFWGRGMGWYFAALVDVLEWMPVSHPDYESLVKILGQVADGLKERQDPNSGVWYQLLQYDNSFVSQCGKKNYLEASASCMFTYAYLKALRLHLIDESYRSIAIRAYQGILDTFITENSDLQIDIHYGCKSAGLGPAKSPNRDGSADYYLCGSDVTVVSNEGKSIGPFIMASLEWELTLNPYEENCPGEPEQPEEPEEPLLPEEKVYKYFTRDTIILTTTDYLSKHAAEGWLSGGETESNKKGTIDPTTGESVSQYNGGGILLKKGNEAKRLETYITGVSSVTAYACTAGSTDRTLLVKATSTSGQSKTAQGISSQYTSTATTLKLDADQKYIVSYTGVETGNEENGADMVLHGIKFETPASVIESIHSESDYNIYNIYGNLVHRTNTPIETIKIPRGLYIIQGKKVLLQ